MKNITNWQKNKPDKLKYIIAIDPVGIGQTGVVIYNVLQKKIIGCMYYLRFLINILEIVE